jgi:hypothetical protein
MSQVVHRDIFFIKIILKLALMYHLIISILLNSKNFIRLWEQRKLVSIKLNRSYTN